MADVPVLAPAAAEAAPAGKSKKTLIIVILLAVVLLAGGGVGAWFAFVPHGKKPKAAKQEPPAPALYVALDPPFVVNFEADQQVRFLQVTAQLMSRDPATIELLKTNVITFNFPNNITRLATDTEFLNSVPRTLVLRSIASPTSRLATTRS